MIINAMSAEKIAMNTQKMVLEGVMNNSILHSAGRCGGDGITIRCELGINPYQC